MLPQPAGWSRDDQALYSRYQAGSGSAAAEALRPLLSSAADSLVEAAVHRSPTGWTAVTYLDSRQAASAALLATRSGETAGAIDAAEVLRQCDASIADGWTAAARALLYRLEPRLRHQGGVEPPEASAQQKVAPEEMQLAQLWTRLVYCSLLDGDRERFELEAAIAERAFGGLAYEPAWNVFAGERPAVPAGGGTIAEAVAAWRGQLIAREAPERQPGRGFDLRLYREMVLDHRFDRSNFVSDAPPPPPEWTELDSGETICVVRGPRQIYAWDADAGSFWPRPEKPELLQWPEETPPAELAGVDWPLLGGIAVEGGRALAVIDEPGKSEAARRRLRDTAALGLDLSRQAAVMPGSPATFGEFAAGLQADGVRGSGRFVGTPLCIGDAAYLLVEESAGTFRVAAFDWPSLEPRWVSEPLGATRPPVVASSPARRSAMLLHQGRLFVCTGRGCVAALDSASGDAMYQVLYESGPEPSRYDAREEPSPPASRLLVDRDVLICNPADCETFFAVRWDDGRVDWQADPAAARRSRQVVAVRDHQAVCVGERVQHFDTARGQLLRAAELPIFATATDPAAASAVGDWLLWSGDGWVFQWPLTAAGPAYQMVAPEDLISWVCPLRGPISFAVEGDFLAVLSAEDWQVWRR